MPKWQFNPVWRGGHWHLVDDFALETVPAEETTFSRDVRKHHPDKCHPMKDSGRSFGYNWQTRDYSRVECKCTIQNSDPNGVLLGTVTYVYHKPEYVRAKSVKPLCGQAGGSLYSSGFLEQVTRAPVYKTPDKYANKTIDIHYVVVPPAIFDGEFPPGRICTYCIRRLNA